MLCFASAASMIRLTPISKRFYHVEIRVSFPSILSAASKFPLGFFDSDCDGDGGAGKADLRLRLCVACSLCVCECGLSRYASFSTPLSLCFSLFSLDVLSLTWPKTNIFAIAAARERLSVSVCVCVCRCWTLTLPLLRRSRSRGRRCRELCLIAPQSQCQSTFGSRLVQFTKKEPQKVNAPRRVHWPRVTCLCVCVS